ncbi:MAG: undecaprenyl-diphosphate phosphatase [Mucinivorans sp.]
MDWFQAILLGLLQGLTEFLPVSSSGHLVLMQSMLGIEPDGNTTFEVMVHAATVLATITVFWGDIGRLLRGGMKFTMNDETKYLLKIVLSMVPVLVVGLFFKDRVEALFNSTVGFIGAMLLITSALLTAAHFISTYRKKKAHPVSYSNAFVIGLAQAVAVIPGISRSGATIATGLMLGDEKANLAKFSFLMVLVPILGEAFLEILGGAISFDQAGLPLLLGFVAAYASGLFACRVMINIVARGKIYYFAIYCAVVGITALIW